MSPFKGETSLERADIVSLEDVINLPPNNLISNPADIGLILQFQQVTKKQMKKTMTTI